MAPIQIGQRVRVIDGRLVHYRQVGTVVTQGEADGWYVHLDYDGDYPDTKIYFHAAELEPAPDAPIQPRHAEHWSVAAGLDHRPAHARQSGSAGDAARERSDQATSTTEGHP